MCALVRSPFTQASYFSRNWICATAWRQLAADLLERVGAFGLAIGHLEDVEARRGFTSTLADLADLQRVETGADLRLKRARGRGSRDRRPTTCGPCNSLYLLTSVREVGALHRVGVHFLGLLAGAVDVGLGDRRPGSGCGARAPRPPVGPVGVEAVASWPRVLRVSRSRTSIDVIAERACATGELDHVPTFSENAASSNPGVQLPARAKPRSPPERAR